MSIFTDDVSGKELQIFRETFTIDSEKADDFAAKMHTELAKLYEYVNISDSMPVFMNNMLCYTITITAGTLI